MKIEMVYNRVKTIKLKNTKNWPSDFLIRYKNKYYMINCYKSKLSDINKVYSLLDKIRSKSQKAFNTYLKHRYDNYITAKEFLLLLKKE